MKILDEDKISLEKIDFVNNSVDMFIRVVTGVKVQHYKDLINILYI